MVDVLLHLEFTSIAAALCDQTKSTDGFVRKTQIEVFMHRSLPTCLCTTVSTFLIREKNPAKEVFTITSQR